MPRGLSAVWISTLPPSADLFGDRVAGIHSPRTCVAGLPSVETMDRPCASLITALLAPGSYGPPNAVPIRTSPQIAASETPSLRTPSSVKMLHAPSIAWSAALPPKTGTPEKTSSIPARTSSSWPGVGAMSSRARLRSLRQARDEAEPRP